MVAVANPRRWRIETLASGRGKAWTLDRTYAGLVGPARLVLHVGWEWPSIFCWALGGGMGLGLVTSHGTRVRSAEAFATNWLSAANRGLFRSGCDNDLDMGSQGTR